MQVTIDVKAVGTIKPEPMDRHAIESLYVEIELLTSLSERTRLIDNVPAGFCALLIELREPYSLMYEHTEEFMAGNHKYQAVINDKLAFQLVEQAKGYDLSNSPLLSALIDACRAVVDFKIFVERNTRTLLLPYQAKT